MSDSVLLHRWQPTRLRCPWYSPGKNTEVGCHFLLQCMKVKSESEVAYSCPTLSDPVDCSLPGFSVHGIFQARVVEWVGIAFPATWLKSILYFITLFLSLVICLCMHAKSLESCPTLCDPSDSSPPGSAVPGILQARTLEWVAISFSKIHTTIYKIINKDLLYSTGNYIQYPILTYNGKESEKEDAYIILLYIWN